MLLTVYMATLFYLDFYSRSYAKKIFFAVLLWLMVFIAFRSKKELELFFEVMNLLVSSGLLFFMVSEKITRIRKEKKIQDPDKKS